MECNRITKDLQSQLSSIPKQRLNNRQTRSAQTKQKMIISWKMCSVIFTEKAALFYGIVEKWNTNNGSNKEMQKKAMLKLDAA